MRVYSNDLGFKQVLVCLALSLLIGLGLTKLGGNKDTAAAIGAESFGILLTIRDLVVRIAAVRELGENIFCIFIPERGGVFVCWNFLTGAALTYLFTRTILRE